MKYSVTIKGEIEANDSEEALTKIKHLVELMGNSDYFSQPSNRDVPVIYKKEGGFVMTWV